jgi:hypothetical protein
MAVKQLGESGKVAHCLFTTHAENQSTRLKWPPAHGGGAWDGFSPAFDLMLQIATSKAADGETT